MKSFKEKDIPTLMQNLGLKGEPLPLWWTGDFIQSDPGQPYSPVTKNKWIVGEFNCSCVGISKCLPAYCNKENPTTGYFDIPARDMMEAMYLGNLMGQKARELLDAKKRSWF